MVECIDRHNLGDRSHEKIAAGARYLARCPNSGAWAHPSWDGVTHFGGTFVNHANGFECKGIPYPAYGGEPRGAHATFTVAFHKCATYATWKGHLRGRKMYMPWSLVYYVNGTPNYLKGVDVFWRIR